MASNLIDLGDLIFSAGSLIERDSRIVVCGLTVPSPRLIVTPRGERILFDAGTIVTRTANLEQFTSCSHRRARETRGYHHQRASSCNPD
jgi:hypothetical protein